MITIDEAAIEYTKIFKRCGTMVLKEKVIQCNSENDFKQGIEFAQRWIPINEELPKHLRPCLFLLDNGDYGIGKCQYFEYGDSELIDFCSMSTPMIIRKFRNWELYNSDRTKKIEITHWRPIELK